MTAPAYAHAVIDELDERVRALEAERLRPVPPPPGRSYGVSPAALALLLDDIPDDDED